jgi:hypothetical protein
MRVADQGGDAFLGYKHGSWGFAGSSALNGTFKPIFTSNFDVLMSVSIRSHWAASGKYLADSERLRSLLQISARSLSGCRKTIIHLHGGWSAGKSYSRLIPPSVAYSFDQALEIINSTCNERTQVFDSLKQQKIIVEQVGRLFKKLDRRTRQVRELHSSVPRVCALSWFRRLWYLLHGGHPPKTECCPAFGCA